MHHNDVKKYLFHTPSIRSQFVISIVVVLGIPLTGLSINPLIGYRVIIESGIGHRFIGSNML